MTRFSHFPKLASPLRSTALALALAVPLAACADQGASPQQTAKRVNDTVPALLDSSIGALSYAQTSTTVTALGQSLSSVNTAFAALPFTGSGTSSSGTQTPAAIPAPASSPSGAAVAQWLVTHVFTADNYEGNGYYLLHGADFCPTDASTGAPDPACVTTFDQAQLRVHVTLAGGGLDIALAVGPDRVEPITLELRPGSLTVALDLGASKSALQFLASITGHMINLPSVMKGTVAASLIVNAPKDVTVELSVRDAVTIQGQTSSGDSFSFSTAAADPLASIRIQAVARKITASLDLGRTTLSAPWQLLSPNSLASGRGAIDWKGLSGTMVLQDGAQSVQISDIGFGDGTSTIKLDNHTLFALDLNPNAGRHFTLTVLPQAGALPTFGFDPKFDLSLAFDLAPLAAAGDSVPSYLMNETYRVLLDGTAPAVQPVAGDPSAGTSGGLRVVSGQLTISSTAASSPVQVNAGQCLLPDPLTSGEHPILGLLTAGDCP